MEKALLNAGLSKHQAKAYIYIVDHFPVNPANIAMHLRLSRTNAYKLADKLVEMGLVAKTIQDKKIVYTPTDPIALSSLIADARTKMIALEKATKEAMRIVKDRIVNDGHTEAKVYRGRSAIVEMFRDQAAQDKDLYFVATPADLPVMSFQTMQQMRHITGPSRAIRYGMTPDVPGAVNNAAVDKTTCLTRTWMPRQAYTTPVEWSACGDELRLFVYASEPYAIQISDKHVADGFRQLWRLLDDSLRQSRDYKNLPRYADRTV
jgi:predicted transcriptional regulator